MAEATNQLAAIPAWVTFIAAVLGGGTGIKVLEWWIKKRRADFDELTEERRQLAATRAMTLAELQARVESHEAREAALTARVDDQARQIAELRADLIMAHKENDALRERIRTMAEIMRQQGIGISLDDLSLDDFGLDQEEEATDEEREDEDA